MRRSGCGLRGKGRGHCGGVAGVGKGAHAVRGGQ